MSSAPQRLAGDRTPRLPRPDRAAARSSARRPARHAALAAALGPVLGATACLGLRGSSTAPVDPHSHAEPARVRVDHVDLDLALDFEARAVRGTARLALTRFDHGAPLVLDGFGLGIERVTGTDGGPRDHAVGPGLPGLGERITVHLAEADTDVTVAYHTTERADALQWLAPEQTAGGAAPFLLTQGQAVLTRSWIPLQDSPGVRVTYAARVRAPEGLTALMAAEQLGRDADGAFLFRMERPIPPYLIALACGDLAFRPLSSRCGVWAEPSVVERARAELEDTEAMVRAAEDLFGPYRWGRFDLLVLPPSFPFGGMENPRLTFATPTILAGDKSLVSLVAHELAHSWSGNLVTNATWRDFWLNEGFTVYFEHRIMERVYGAERATMERQLARAELERELAGMEPWEQVLHVDLAGRHPDDGFSGVPYDKGCLFLMRLEELFGRPRLDWFLRSWFDGHAFQSVTTETFRAFLESELIGEDASVANELDVDEWLEAPGLPADAPDPRSSLLGAVDGQVAWWRAARAEGRADDASLLLVTGAWSTQEWLHFLEAIAGEVDRAGLADLDRRFQLTDSGNAEILCVWLRLAVEQGYSPADGKLRAFLREVGRRKFLQPLYAALLAADPARARALYAENRARYHAVSRGTLDELLGVGG